MYEGNTYLAYVIMNYDSYQIVILNQFLTNNDYDLEKNHATVYLFSKDTNYTPFVCKSKLHLSFNITELESNIKNIIEDNYFDAIYNPIFTSADLFVEYFSANVGGK